MSEMCQHLGSATAAPCSSSGQSRSWRLDIPAILRHCSTCLPGCRRYLSLSLLL